MNYREVKCSNRLPDKRNTYHVIQKEHEVYGKVPFHAYFDPNNGHDKVVWLDRYESWLEPYELPTEEEMERILYKAISELCKFPVTASQKGAKAITNLLKGKKK